MSYISVLYATSRHLRGTGTEGQWGYPAGCVNIRPELSLKLSTYGKSPNGSELGEICANHAHTRRKNRLGVMISYIRHHCFVVLPYLERRPEIHVLEERNSPRVRMDDPKFLLQHTWYTFIRGSVVVYCKGFVLPSTTLRVPVTSIPTTIHDTPTAVLRKRKARPGWISYVREGVFDTYFKIKRLSNFLLSSKYQPGLLYWPVSYHLCACPVLLLYGAPT